MKTLVFATRNKGKLAELEALVAPLGLNVVSAAELDAPEVVEDCDTFEANATIGSDTPCVVLGHQSDLCRSGERRRCRIRLGGSQRHSGI